MQGLKWGKEYNLNYQCEIKKKRIGIVCIFFFVRENKNKIFVEIKEKKKNARD